MDRDPYGHHVAAWRHPATPGDAGYDFAHWKRLARTAEAEKFDAIFLADIVAAGAPGDGPEAIARNARGAHFEPLTLLSALAAVTERIGLVSTVTTTYNEPYHVARKFASLDHLSGGRAGWNLVTLANATEAWNFGRDHHLEHGRRYQRAEEFIDIVTALWDSWQDDAFVRDKDEGRFVDSARLHPPAYRGREFAVCGPLNVARPPQGWPVRVQAGSSGSGMELATRTADVVFTAQQTLDGAKAFYRDLKGRLARHGRDAADLLVMPGLFAVVGRTQAEAEVKFARLQELIRPEVGLALLSAMIRRVRPLGLRRRRPGARPAREQRGQEPPGTAVRHRPAREPQPAPALGAPRRRARPPADRRHAREHRRLHRGVARRGRRRRLQHHAADPARGSGRLHRAGAARAAPARALPHRVRGRHALRENLGLARPAHPAALRIAQAA